MVKFRTVTKPTDKILEATAMSTLINNVLDKSLFVTMFSRDGSMFIRGVEFGVIFMNRKYLKCVEDGVKVGIKGGMRQGECPIQN